MDGKCYSCPAKPAPSASSSSTSDATEPAALSSSAPNVRHPRAPWCIPRGFDALSADHAHVQPVPSARLGYGLILAPPPVTSTSLKVDC